ncbi:MAG: C40 family peptidase [Candidatus Methylacidiphilales bacterium]|nr:NlpC/P60 family protein [Candidatus Methylacidiphilales bacterium]
MMLVPALILSACLAAPDSINTAEKIVRPAPTPPAASTPDKADRTASLTTADLKEYADQPEAVQRLILEGLALTRLGLAYKYGSADPKNGGMDCSGTIYYLLNQAGLKEVPRDASEIYTWVWKKSAFQAVVSTNPKTFELDRLKPGDLLFWTGTYTINRDPPVTHVMLYLGTHRQTGRRVMLGASEGRTYANISRHGVSVFDFKLPGTAPALPSVATDLKSRFIGYGPVPGLEQSLARP